MAPVAMILGGMSGTFSALLGWVLFGLGFWAAAQVYFLVGLGVAGILIAMALLRPRGTRTGESGGLQRA